MTIKAARNQFCPLHCGNPTAEGLGWQKLQNSQRPHATDVWNCSGPPLVSPTRNPNHLELYLLHDQTRPLWVKGLVNYRWRIVELAEPLDRLNGIWVKSHAFVFRHWWGHSDSRGSQRCCSWSEPSRHLKVMRGLLKWKRRLESSLGCLRLLLHFPLAPPAVLTGFNPPGSFLNFRESLLLCPIALRQKNPLPQYTSLAIVYCVFSFVLFWH